MPQKTTKEGIDRQVGISEFIYKEKSTDYTFAKVPTKVLHNTSLSSDAVRIYVAMLDTVSLSIRNDWSDSLGRIYIIYTLEKAMKLLSCADKTATRCMKELERAGLIEKKRRGQGKPDLVYVKLPK